MIEEFTINVIAATKENLKICKPETADDIRTIDSIVAMYPDMEKDFEQLRDVLFSRVYRHPNVLIMVEKGRKIIRDLFEVFTDKPQLMPWVTQRKFNEAYETAKKWRVVCDFISGMTDRYAMETYSRLFEPNEKVMQKLI